MDPLVVVPGQIDVTILPGRLVVCHAETVNIPRAGWLITRTLLFNEGSSKFNAVILDEEGCTMVMDEARAAEAKRVGLDSFVSMEKDLYWTAIHVQLGQSANDVPGLISHMAKALMRAGISTLHYSTYSTEIFLVQEKDRDEALACFASENVKSKLNALMRDSSNRNPRGDSTCPPSPSQSPKIRPSDNAFSLEELDQRIFIARVKREYFRDVTRTLLQLFLYDAQHYHASLLSADANTPHLKSASEGVGRTTGDSVSPPSDLLDGDGDASLSNLSPNRQPEPRPMRFVVGYMESGDEITLYLDLEDLHLFPVDAIEICPTPWRGIKLMGRAFKFDETGVVSAMSKVSDNVSILSLSTYQTTVTMVEQAEVEDTMRSLSTYLDAKIRRSEVPLVEAGELQF